MGQGCIDLEVARDQRWGGDVSDSAIERIT